MGVVLRRLQVAPGPAALLAIGLAVLVDLLVQWLSDPPGPLGIVGGGVVLVAAGWSGVRVIQVALRGARYVSGHAADATVCVAFSLAALCSGGPGWTGAVAASSGVLAIATIGRVRVLAVGLLLAATAGVLVVEGSRGTGVLTAVATQVAVTFAIAAVATSSGRVAAVERSRTETARAAVADERLRFARDLHDTLGQRLSLIRLKSEVARLLAGRDIAAAETEIVAIGHETSAAIAEMRRLVLGYRRSTVAAELASVRQVFELAGVRSRVDPVPSGLPDDVEDVVGWIVREGGTNVVRHSRASVCEITLRVVDDVLHVAVVNDGCGVRSGPRPSGAGGGNGLVGLAERVRAVGGTLAAGPEPSGGYALRAEFDLVFGGPGGPGAGGARGEEEDTR